MLAYAVAHVLKTVFAALARWLRQLDHRPVHQKVVGSIPGWGSCWRPPIDLSLFLSKNE